jgi:hypothetical protein
MAYPLRLVVGNKAARRSRAVTKGLRNAGIMAAKPAVRQSESIARRSNTLSPTRRQNGWRGRIYPAIPTATPTSSLPPVLFSYEHILGANEI